MQKRLRVHAAHALYIHCSYHRLQLASMQAAESISAIKKMFGTMSNLWKLFYYSPKKAEAIEGPELTVVDFDNILDIFKEKDRHILL